MLGWKGQEVVRDLEELGIPAHRHFLPLDGGNVQLARNRAGRRFVVLGSEEFSCGVDTLPDSDSAGSRFDQTREAYRRTFGADEVLVLPNLAHAHIDQTVFFVADGVAVTEIMPEPTDADRRLMVNFQVEWANASSSGTTFKVALYPAGYSGETRHVTSNWTTGTHGEAIPELFMTAEQREVFLRYQAVCPHLNDLVHTDRVRKNRVATERLLVDRGFEIVHLKTSVWHEFNCQNYVNAMPFRNRETGRPGVLLPVYRHPGAPSEPVDLDDLRGLNRENVGILRAHGFDVVAVPSHVQLGGNLHCSILQF